MPALQCSVCEVPVYNFSSILELGEKKNQPFIKAASEAHAAECSGQRPPPLPREQLPHRYTDGRPFVHRPKGPCDICGNGARHHLHYQDGRYL